MMSHEQYRSPAVVRVDHLLEHAFAHRASDIHCEPTRDGLRVRLRIDGILHDDHIIPVSLAASVVARIKVMAHLDVVEKRLPQDGNFTITYRNEVHDVRVATFPAVIGEKVVLRLLDRSDALFSLDQLGFELAMLEKIRALLRRSTGFFLVTGPTGSGKTTTLYAALSELRAPEKNIVTLEDPVEYHLAGITQGPVNADIGFTFDRGIRALVRQDPDIIMVGEIRDAETAKVALQAALTGHLVLSTTHTIDAPSALMRLRDMGVEPYQITSGVTGIVAQRLARKLCQKCKREVAMDATQKAFSKKHELSIAHVFSAPGCTACLHRGYSGRVGIFQFMPLSQKIREGIIQEISLDEVALLAEKEGMKTLLHDAAGKVNAGAIAWDELFAVEVD